MPTEPSFKSPSGAAKVLLVDDDNAIRFSLGRILGHHGFNVSSASNVSDALRLISSDLFDVLLSDLHMPGPGDGLTVVSAMRHSNDTLPEQTATRPVLLDKAGAEKKIRKGQTVRATGSTAI